MLIERITDALGLDRADEYGPERPQGVYSLPVPDDKLPRWIVPLLVSVAHGQVGIGGTLHSQGIRFAVMLAEDRIRSNPDLRDDINMYQWRATEVGPYSQAYHDDLEKLCTPGNDGLSALSTHTDQNPAGDTKRFYETGSGVIDFTQQVSNTTGVYLQPFYTCIVDMLEEYHCHGGYYGIKQDALDLDIEYRIKMES